MTLNALALEIIQALDEDQNDLQYVGVVENYIRNALSELNIATRWHFARTTTTFNTVAATATYDVPSGLGEVQMLRMSSPRQTIEYIENPVYLAERGWDFNEVGAPKFWWWDDATIIGTEQRFRLRLTPVPDGVYTIEMFGLYNVDTIASGNHIPLQADMLVVLKHRVRAYILEHDKDYDGADRYNAKFAEGIGLAMKKLNSTINSLMSEMQVVDAPNSRNPLARLDPSHFGR